MRFPRYRVLHVDFVLALCLLAAAVSQSWAATTYRMSIATTSVQATDNCLFPVVNADGSQVAFLSLANNLVADDTNNSWDIFVRNRNTGSTTRVSVNSAEVQGDDDSGDDWEHWKFDMSADGRYVAFASKAANLVTNDVNVCWDVFVRDTVDGTTERVSVSSAGAEGNGDSYHPSISADGRYVAFRSYASNLVTSDTNGTWDIFVYDRQTHATTRVSVDSSGVQSNGSSWAPEISEDGTGIAFVSNARNLVVDDLNYQDDVFLRRWQSNQTLRISVATGGREANGNSWAPAISANGQLVAFVSNASNLVGDTNGRDDIYVRDLSGGGKTTRVSVSGSGLQSHGHSAFPDISGDGRFVVFETGADNLIAGDTNYCQDVMLYDRTNGAISRVSLASDGIQQGTGSSYQPTCSADGRYIAFASDANNLVVGDSNSRTDAFLHDRGALSAYQPDLWLRNSGEAEFIGQNDYVQSLQIEGRGVPRDGTAVYHLRLQNDGTAGDTFTITGFSGNTSWGVHYFTGFSGGSEITTAVTATSGWTTTSLAPGATLDFRVEVTAGSSLAYGTLKNIDVTAASTGANTRTDLIRLTTTVVSVPEGQVIRVNVADNAQQANDYGYNAAANANGRYVAFLSPATNLVAGDRNDRWDVFVHDQLTRTMERVSISSEEAQGDEDSGDDWEHWKIDISADGRYVAFASRAANLVPGDLNECWDVFVRDRQTGTTERVSVSSEGLEGNGDSYHPSISADGRYVAYRSHADNLVVADTNGNWDIFVYDRQTCQTWRVSVDSGGVQAEGSSWAPAISGDGSSVAFVSNAGNLVLSDTNYSDDVFVCKWQSGETLRVSVGANNTQANGGSWAPAISYNGQVIAFVSNATNLVGDTNSRDDIFVHDLGAGETTRVSVGSSGLQANGHSDNPHLSGDGRYVVYESGASNLVTGDDNYATDIFRYDRQASETTRVSVTQTVEGELQATGSSYTPRLSTDGRFVVFSSTAANLVNGDTNGDQDIFIQGTGLLPVYQPDAQVRLSGEGDYLGDDVYSLDGTGQTKSSAVDNGTTISFYVKVQNDGNGADSFKLTSSTVPAGWTVKYYTPANADVTTQVTNPGIGWTTDSLDAQGYTYLRVTVQPTTSITPGTTLTLLLSAKSVADGTTTDAAGMAVTVRKIQPDGLVRAAGDSNYLGENVYNLTGSSQTKTVVTTPGMPVSYYARIQNDGNVVDSIVITGIATPAGWTVKYYGPQGQDITSQVASPGTGWSTGNLDPQASTSIRISVMPGTSTAEGQSLTVPLTLTSATDAAKKDVVQALTALRKYQVDALVRAAGETAYLGENIYNITGVDQNKLQGVEGAGMATYYIQVQNDGNVADAFKVTAPAAAAGWTIRYYTPIGTNVTGQIAAPATGWSTGTLAAGTYTFLRVTVQPTGATGTCALLVTVASTNNTAKKDAVKLTTAIWGFQPDAQIRLASETSYAGDNTYNGTGTSQTKNSTLGTRAYETYYVRLQNDGTMPDELVLTAQASALDWTVRYYDALGNEITDQITNTPSYWLTSILPAQGTTYIRIVVQPGASVAQGATCTVTLTAISAADYNKKDVVKAVTTR